MSYEPSARALVLALHTGGLLPTAVVADLADALAGLNVSEGTVCTWAADAAGALDGFDAVCVQLLNAAGVLGADETPVKCVDAAGEPATVYVHAAVSGKVTRFHTGARSSAAITAGGIVGSFAGTLVSDCAHRFRRGGRVSGAPGTTQPSAPSGAAAAGVYPRLSSR